MYEDIKKLIKLFPETERVVIQYANTNGEIIYVVTETKRTGEGNLYKLHNNKYKKIKTSDIPYFEEPEKFLKNIKKGRENNYA